MGLASYGSPLLGRRFPASDLNFSLKVRDVINEIDAVSASLRTPHHRFYRDRKSTRLNSSHSQISYAVFCLKKKKDKDNSRLIIYSTISITDVTIETCRC